MPRRHRKDFIGAWWHIVNRGVAHRAIFESAWEYRYFLALLALAVRRGDLEIHAYCLMANHFHLLVRSPRGEISAIMQWIQDQYARRFNVRRDRRGPLFEGRFRGKIVNSLTYRRAVIGYVHRNPVHAGITDDALSYPYSSARHYAIERGRPWLSRQFGREVRPAVLYGDAVSAELVERWFASPAPDLPVLDELVTASDAAACRWLAQNAVSADGALIPRVLTRAHVVHEAIDRFAEQIASLALPARRGRVLEAVDTMRAGLLRSLTSAPRFELAADLECSATTVATRLRVHTERLGASPAYRHLAAGISAWCLRGEHREILR